MNVAERTKYSEVEVIAQESFEQLFLKLYPVMCGVADRYLNDEILSKDIVQEAFIKLWEQQSQLSNILSIKSYLYTTVRNLSLNYIRDHQLKVVALDLSTAGLLIDEIEGNLIEEETIYLLYQAIGRLAPQSSKVILLSLQGYKNTEIAKQLGISVNSVKTLKYNALKILKGELKDLFPMLVFLLNINI